MVPNHAVVHPDIADELLRRLGRSWTASGPATPTTQTLLSPVVRSEKFFAFLVRRRCRGPRSSGRAPHRDRRNRRENGPFLQPTVLRVDGLAGARLVDAVREETFFPLLRWWWPSPATTSPSSTG